MNVRKSIPGEPPFILFPVISTTENTSGNQLSHLKQILPGDKARFQTVIPRSLECISDNPKLRVS